MPLAKLHEVETKMKILILSILLLSLSAEIAETRILGLDCPLRFVGISPRIDQLSLPSELFQESTLEIVQLLSPRTEGFAVIRVEESAREAIYASYRSEANLHFQKFTLSEGSRSVSWRAASTDGRPPAILPGHYRLVLRYLSPNSPESGDNRICLAMSNSFEIDKEYVLIGS